MAGVNKVILIGNLGADPEVRHLDNETSVATFSLATSETYTDKSGQKQTLTEWHRIVAWRGLATISERFLKKGSKVYIEGKLATRSYQDKDNVTRYVTEVVARDMTLLDKKEGGNDSYVPPPQEMPAGMVNTRNSAPVAPAAGAQDMGGGAEDLPF